MHMGLFISKPAYACESVYCQASLSTWVCLLPSQHMHMDLSLHIDLSIKSQHMHVVYLCQGGAGVCWGVGGVGVEGSYLTGRVKGGKKGSPLHKSLRQDLPHMLSSNTRQRCIFSCVCSVAALRQHEVAHVYDDAC